MNSLEKRLQETETALHSALIVLEEQDNLGSVSLKPQTFPSNRTAKVRSKAEKQEEWKQHPLQSAADLKVWLQDRQQYDMPTTTPLQLGESLVSQYNSSESTAPFPPPDLGQAKPARQSQPDPTFDNVLEKLKNCQAPIIPNMTGGPSSSAWQENYF